MYCHKCGKEVFENDQYCPYCGQLIKNFVDISVLDKPNIWINILCFFIPVVTIFFFLVWLKTFPNKAKSCALWGILGLLFKFCLRLFFVIMILF